MKPGSFFKGAEDLKLMPTLTAGLVSQSLCKSRLNACTQFHERDLQLML